MSPLFQIHLSVEETVSSLREACLELANRLDQEGADHEKIATAYAQAEKYNDALRALQDFLIG